MIAVVQLTKVTVAGALDINRVRFLASQTLLALAAGVIVYLGGAWVLKIREIRS